MDMSGDKSMDYRSKHVNNSCLWVCYMGWMDSCMCKTLSASICIINIPIIEFRSDDVTKIYFYDFIFWKFWSIIWKSFKINISRMQTHLCRLNIDWDMSIWKLNFNRKSLLYLRLVLNFMNQSKTKGFPIESQFFKWSYLSQYSTYRGDFASLRC